jgi:hypothetical protein
MRALYELVGTLTVWVPINTPINQCIIVAMYLPVGVRVWPLSCAAQGRVALYLLVMLFSVLAQGLAVGTALSSNKAEFWILQLHSTIYWNWILSTKFSVVQHMIYKVWWWKKSPEDTRYLALPRPQLALCAVCLKIRTTSEQNTSRLLPGRLMGRCTWMSYFSSSPTPLCTL